MKCPDCKKYEVMTDPDDVLTVKCPGCNIEHSINYVIGFWDGWHESGQAIKDAIGTLRVNKA